MDTLQIALLTVVLGLLVALVVLYPRSPKSELGKKSFVILGANGSGKTALYYALLDPNAGFTNTVLSIKPNIGVLSLPFSKELVSINFQLIDYPGHAKYSQLLNKLIENDVGLQNIKGIVYVIDSSANVLNQQEYIVEIARFLFNLFSHTERVMGGIDILMAVNKKDLFDSRPEFKVKEQIEQQITEFIHRELASTGRSSGIDLEDENESENLRDFWLPILGSETNKFNFEMLEGSVTFIGGSVLSKKMEPWKHWFDERAVN